MIILQLVLHFSPVFLSFAFIFRLKNDSGARTSIIQPKCNQITKHLFKNPVTSAEGTSAINLGIEDGDRSYFALDFWGALHQSLPLQNKTPTDKKLLMLHLVITRVHVLLRVEFTP